MWKDERICTKQEIESSTKSRITILIPLLTDSLGNKIRDEVKTRELFIEDNNDA